jgi:glyoxylase-like metal-dependent hydrolase (beta-lactamase superfamily II)
MTIWTEGGREAAMCVACSTQFPPGTGIPDACPICSDDRQYIPDAGQRWTTLGDEQGRHHNSFEEVEPGVTRITTTPKLGIGQHAWLIETAGGRILWDLVGYVDETTIAEVERRGGIDAFAISHCHYYSTMVEWSHALGDVPILIHEADREWVMRPDERVNFWSGDTLDVLDGVTLIRTGGHFPGGQVLHVDGSVHPHAAGLLFVGDIIQVVQDRHMVTFMYSYPNAIPLDPGSVRRMADMVKPHAFDRVYGAFPGGVVPDRGSEVVQASADRYIAHVTADPSTTIG